MAGEDREPVTVDVAGVDVVGGTRPRVRGVRRLSSRPGGELASRLAPFVVRELAAQLAVPYARERRLLVVGSPPGIEGAEVWGTPATEPLLLLGGLRPDLVVAPGSRSGTTVIADGDAVPGTGRRTTVGSRTPLGRLLARVGGSELVVATSLPGVIAAEALGVSARLVANDAGSDAEEYYAATGRSGDEVASTIQEATERGGAPGPVWDPYPTLEAFPVGLWGVDADPTMIAAIGWRARQALAARTDA